MTSIKIFKDDTEIDLEKLIETRLIYIANSGSGKSYAFRKLIEEVNNQVMTIILDVEGEYKTLREKFDFLLIGGAEGDIPINMKSAGLLPKKIFENNISTIIDISELKSGERIQYAKKFLEAIMELPQKLWKPCILGIEETHKLCGQMDRHDSGPAVIDIFTRGRKRGICGIAITQRIAKLHKDVVAECNNVFSGRMWLPNDIKTASQILGMGIKEAFELLRNLKPGELHCFGPAINKNIHRGMIDTVKTTHIKVGIELKERITPPTSKIKNMLKKLNDLPKEADIKLKEKQDYIKKIHQLESQLRAKEHTIRVREKEFTKAGTHKVMANMTSFRLMESSRDKMIKEAQNLTFQLETTKQQLEIAEKIIKESKNQSLHGKNIIEKMSPLLQKLVAIDQNIREFYSKPKIEVNLPEGVGEIIDQKKENPEAFKPIPQFSPKQYDDLIEEKPLGKCAKLIYSFLYANQDKEFTKIQLAFMIKYSHKSSNFDNSIYSLNSRELINRGNGIISINPDNIDTEAKEGEVYSIDSIKNHLPKCARAIFEELLENPEKEYSKEELATITQYSSLSSNFDNSIYKLNSLGFIKRNKGIIQLSKDVGELL